MEKVAAEGSLLSGPVPSPGLEGGRAGRTYASSALGESAGGLDRYRALRSRCKAFSVALRALFERDGRPAGWTPPLEDQGDRAALNPWSHLRALLEERSGEARASEDLEWLALQDAQEQAHRLEALLSAYRVGAKVVSVRPGPWVSVFELQLSPGVKGAKVSALASDLARGLAVAQVVVQEVVPGTPYLGLEVPRTCRREVRLRELLSHVPPAVADQPLLAPLGSDRLGQPHFIDLAPLPHLLVAGTTGSGKTTLLNSLLISWLGRSHPRTLQVLLIDLKQVELSVYNPLLHLVSDAIVRVEEAMNALEWVVSEMERRLQLFSKVSVKNLEEYHHHIQGFFPQFLGGIGENIASGGSVFSEFQFKLTGTGSSSPEPLPRLVVVVDEFSELMWTLRRQVERLVLRLAQKARAAGIHLVLTTQRPSVGVVTGLIKANFATRVALRVASKADSRIILDQSGAEQLFGEGDMLLRSAGRPMLRLHGARVRDHEIRAVVDFWVAQLGPRSLAKAGGLADHWGARSVEDGQGVVGSALERDAYFEQAVAFVLERGQGSISALQRRLRIGYNRAAKLVEALERAGILGPPHLGGVRPVQASLDRPPGAPVCSSRA